MSLSPTPDGAPPARQTSSDPSAERWTVFGIPTFITKQVDPGDVIAFTMVYEPTEDREDRYRISAVKVIGIGEAAPTP